MIFLCFIQNLTFNIGVQNYNKGFIREKAFKIFFRTSNGQILNEAQVYTSTYEGLGILAVGV
jgi:hypothetical protein